MDSSHKIVSIENEGNKSRLDILSECNLVYKKFRDANIRPDDTKSLDAFREKIIKDHKQLYHAYPLVIRHMIDDGIYHPKAFNRYLKHVETKPWKTEDEQLESYADYFLILTKQLNPKYNPNAVNAIRSDYLNRLTAERKQFNKTLEEKKSEVELEEDRFFQERKAATLVKFLEMAAKLNFSQELIDSVKLKLDLKLIDMKTLEGVCDVFIQEEKSKEFANVYKETPQNMVVDVPPKPDLASLLLNDD